MVKGSQIVRVVLIFILLYIIGQALFNWYLSIQSNNKTPLIEKFSNVDLNINDNVKKCKNEILSEIPLPTIPIYSSCEEKINKIEKIPMIIHQIEVSKCMNGFDSWRKDYIKQYPDFKYILWNKEKIDNDLDWSEELSNIYNMEKDEKGKTDILRLMILQKYGGIFIDYDIVWNKITPKSLEDLINLSNNNAQNFFIGKEPNQNWVSNSVIGSIKNHPALNYLLNKLEDIGSSETKYIEIREKTPSYVVLGSQFVNKIVTEGFNVTVMQEVIFYPRTWTSKTQCDQKLLEDVPENSYMISMFYSKHW